LTLIGSKKRPLPVQYKCECARRIRGRTLRHAVEKAAGDRERVIRNVCRLYTVNRFDALPGAIRAALLALLDQALPTI
jgi:hypothetical protein